MTDPETFLSGRVSLYPGDCREVLRALPDASVDSVVTDPPYALVSIHKRFAKSPRSETTELSAAGPYQRTGRGFMGQTWDTGETAFAAEFWAEVLRVLKPGGHVVAFSGTRTYHRMVCAIEDAGFEIRDQIGWAFGSGFPKSHDVSKGIDRAAGVPVSDDGYVPNGKNNTHGEGWGGGRKTAVSAPATDAAREWSGWGTALKPAWEPICLARKPLDGTVAANVLAHGTGALNIDGCRIESGGEHMRGVVTTNQTRNAYGRQAASFVATDHPSGRWPANLIHDGSGEVLAAFPSARSAGDYPSRSTARDGVTSFSGDQGQLYADTGSAARFFYSAKADADDRLGSKHPTVKPVDLMQYLVRLVTPPGGLVLDPFAGTGTTGEAAWREGMRTILVERESAYQDDIRRRMALCLAGPDERRRATIKARGGDAKMEPLPLFGGAE